MDPITHTLTGIIAAHALFKKRLGPETIAILAVAANMPDVDAFTHLTGDQNVILIRRTFGHSIFMIPLWALAFSWIFKKIYPRFSWKTLWGLFLFGGALHLCFDLVNSFGVKILWPFSWWQPEWAIIFILDPILTGLLAWPLAAYLIRSWRPRLELFSRLSVGLTAAYIFFCAASRSLAWTALEQEAKSHGAAWESIHLYPEPLGPHRWHGVIRFGDTMNMVSPVLYKSYRVHSFSGEVRLDKEIATAENDPRIQPARATDIARRIERFFRDPVWEVHPPSGNAMSQKPNAQVLEASVYDLRLNSPLMDRSKPFEFHFIIELDGRARQKKNGIVVPYSGILTGLKKP